MQVAPSQSPLSHSRQRKPVCTLQMKTHSQPQNFFLTGSTGLLTFNLPPNSPFCPMPSLALMVSRYGHFSASAACATREWMRCCGTDMKVRQDEWDSGMREGTWIVPCSRALSNLSFQYWGNVRKPRHRQSWHASHISQEGRPHPLACG